MEQMGRAFPLASHTVRVLALPKILLPFLLFRSPITQATIIKGQQWCQGVWGRELSPLPTFYSHPPPLQKIRLPCSDYTETTRTSVSIR